MIFFLQGAGKLSICHTKLDKDTMQALIPKVIDLFIKVLSLEVAEKSLCHCLEMLSLWTSKLEAELPKKLIETIKVNYLKFRTLPKSKSAIEFSLFYVFRRE